jgi:hypothetical protein
MKTTLKMYQTAVVAPIDTIAFTQSLAPLKYQMVPKRKTEERIRKGTFLKRRMKAKTKAHITRTRRTAS